MPKSKKVVRCAHCLDKQLIPWNPNELKEFQRGDVHAISKMLVKLAMKQGQHYCRGCLPTLWPMVFKVAVP